MRNAASHLTGSDDTDVFKGDGHMRFSHVLHLQIRWRCYAYRRKREGGAFKKRAAFIMYFKSKGF
ncbi:hypothetical protein O3S81_22375, partial [Agrobacterium sp. SOY23]|uniref:hypothetical protein n=1 Tax=Agrobacterium sp. SOY23 TaxID=3014555 RepID=UPI0022B03974